MQQIDPAPSPARPSGADALIDPYVTTAAHRQHWLQHGYVALPGLLSPPQVAA